MTRLASLGATVSAFCRLSVFVFKAEMLCSVWMTNGGEMGYHSCDNNAVSLCERDGCHLVTELKVRLLMSCFRINVYSGRDELLLVEILSWIGFCYGLLWGFCAFRHALKRHSFLIYRSWWLSHTCSTFSLIGSVTSRWGSSCLGFCLVNFMFYFEK